MIEDDGFANSPAYDVWRTECALAAAIKGMQAHAAKEETRGLINKCELSGAQLALALIATQPDL